FGGVTKDLAGYSNPDNDPRGPWASDNLTANKGFYARPRTYYPVYNPETDIYYPCDPNRVWAFASRERVKDGQRLRGQTSDEMGGNARVVRKDEPEVAQYATEAERLSAIIVGTAPPNRNVYQDLERTKTDVAKGNAPEAVL